MKRFAWVESVTAPHWPSGTPIICGGLAKCEAFYKRHGGCKRGLALMYTYPDTPEDREHIAELRFMSALANQ